MSNYYIEPRGTPSHASVLCAVGGVPSDRVASWLKNGKVVKGPVTPSQDPSILCINTGMAGDASFWAGDAGSKIEFGVEGAPTDMVVLGNSLPKLKANLVTDSLLRCSEWPTIVWDFLDEDGDAQFLYRVRLGTSPLSSNLYDTGTVIKGAAAIRSFTLPREAYSNGFPPGLNFYWALDASDGEKSDLLGTDCMTVTTSGKGTVNHPPTIGAIRINGIPGGEARMQPTRDNRSREPTIAWDYGDEDGHPQKAFRVIVSLSRDPMLGLRGGDQLPGFLSEAESPILWDSEQVPTSISFVRYGSTGRLAARKLPLCKEVYVGVSVFDGVSWSPFEQTP